MGACWLTAMSQVLVPHFPLTFRAACLCAAGNAALYKPVLVTAGGMDGGDAVLLTDGLQDTCVEVAAGGLLTVQVDLVRDAAGLQLWGMQ